MILARPFKAGLGSKVEVFGRVVTNEKGVNTNEFFIASLTRRWEQLGDPDPGFEKPG